MQKDRSQNTPALEWIHKALRPLAEPLEELTPDPDNVRIHGETSLAGIVVSLRQFGQRKPIVVNRTNGQIEAGNGIYRAARYIGWSHLAVVWVEDDPTAQYGFAIADNRTAELSEWDTGRLEALLSDVWETTPDLYDDLLLADLRSPKLEKQTVEDELPEVQESPVTQPGDLWLMGRHRVLCGDCCEPENRDKLLSEEKAMMIFTDPPYNINYTGKTKKSLKITNDKMSPAGFRAFLFRAFRSLHDVVLPGGAIYVCHADTESIDFRRALTEAGWRLSQTLVWVKNTLVMGRSDYHWRHEPILYGWKPGASHRFHGDRKQSTVWQFPKPARNAEHPTIKPVGIPGRAVRNSSVKGDVVLDFFLGSGSTLSACEQLGRRCFAMELDPRYVDVICRRYLNLTGQSPIRKSDGVKFTECSIEEPRAAV